MIDLHLARLLRSAAGHQDASVVFFEGRGTTLAEELVQGDVLAEALVHAGVQEGDRVAVYDTTSPLILRSLYATAVLGAVLVPLNFRWSLGETHGVLADAGATVVIVGDGAPIDLVGPVPIVREPGAGTTAVRRQVVDHPVVVQMYTSGTTGQPKGVLITHDNLMGKFVREPNPWDIDSGSTVLACMPLFHIGGLGWLVGAVVRCADVVIAAGAAPVQVLTEVRRHGVTHLFLVPAALAAVLEHRGDRSMPTVTTVAYGASPMEPSLLAAAMDTWDVDFVQGYGLTETTGQIVSLSGAEHRAWRLRTGPWPVGRADDGMEISVRPVGATEGSSPLEEIIVRGDQVTAGYFGAGPVTDPDGWFATGDLGKIDAEGFVYVLDRVKDLIISGGENIMPAEVEQLLESHELVQEAAVVGIPSSRWGEVPLALVVAADHRLASEVGALQELCRERLAGFKRPVGFEIVAELPRNAVGKILKRELRESWANWQSRVERSTS